MRPDWQLIADNFSDDQLIRAANNFEFDNQTTLVIFHSIFDATTLPIFLAQALAQRLQKANEQYNELLAHIGPDTRIDDI